MLRTRIWVGSLLAAAAAGVLFGDAFFAPHYPILLAAILFLGWFGTQEFWRMLSAGDRPAAPVVALGVPLVLAANWFSVLSQGIAAPWQCVIGAFVAAVLVAFLYEIGTYSADGHSSRRVAFSVLLFAYLGLLPSFLVQLRWLPVEVSGAALAAAIFVPKVGDIFALLTGMAFGRHKLTPLLSPKKTWEGFAGGMLAAMATAVGFRYLSPELFHHDTLRAVAFGLCVGLMGVFGDLAESMLKRDCQIKDASKSIPGFGGVLDVVDSVIFAAPVAYLFFTA
ncbi:phosphatidate cytidylyltransferase [Limnoglobus roseus]|uniref:Phosphatidate cytidylyltransferase n=1 Tax=Limnoglobus roseus TaxID=2598579 RepID=A0A5C1AMK9_9BACT|nr:phosphatidate cytidylyltransferase [Limnoglobus roseus]QEL18444.1 phosphatidate cytidylyltransferase [Limnoglobus roseus]